MRSKKKETPAPTRVIVARGKRRSRGAPRRSRCSLRSDVMSNGYSPFFASRAKLCIVPSGQSNGRQRPAKLTHCLVSCRSLSGPLVVAVSFRCSNKFSILVKASRLYLSSTRKGSTHQVLLRNNLQQELRRRDNRCAGRNVTKPHYMRQPRPFARRR